MFERITLGKTDAGLDFDLTLDPGKKLYCFIGKNGVGKTNLLANLTRVLLSCPTTFRPQRPGEAGAR
jgi:recombinational DNA repair ATPase RecF